MLTSSHWSKLGHQGDRSHIGEPQESIRACLNAVFKDILEIICVHAGNCSHSHLSCNVGDANSKRVLAHLFT